MNEFLGTAFIVIGLAFDFLGCLGLIRLPDVYNRLQAAAKCVTVGTCGILFGLFLYQGLTATGIKALLCLGFILLTAPVSAHALARGAYRAGVKPCKGTVCDAYGEDLKKEKETVCPCVIQNFASSKRRLRRYFEDRTLQNIL